MSKIAIHSTDNTKFPNFALMKIAAYHKIMGDSVEWFTPLFDNYDKIYTSKIFTFSREDEYLPLDNRVVRGGTGYGALNSLPKEIDSINCLDYSIYPNLYYKIGYITRGCVRKCSWCIVPQKEGYTKPYRHIKDIAKAGNVVLMDNNILSSDYGIKQLEIISKMNLKIDINQGNDARLIDDYIARLYGKIKWYKPIRLACDTVSQIPSIEKAVKLLRKYNATPKAYFCYVLVKDINDALERVEFLRSIGVDAFAQPYRDFKNNTEPSNEQKKFSRWVNRKAIFKTVKWEKYSNRHV